MKCKCIKKYSYNDKKVTEEQIKENIYKNENEKEFYEN